MGLKSEQYKRLMNTLHNLKKKVDRIDLRFGNSITGKVTFDDGEVMQVDESDAIHYLMTMKRIIDKDGDFVFHPVKDTERYLNEERFLCYDHDNKVAAASHELASGSFEFSYDFEGLQEEFLLSNKRYDKKYLPLKTDYFRIAASRINEAAMMQKLHRKHLKDSPEYKKHFDAVGKIVAAAFRSNPNFMKNFMKRDKNAKLNLLESMNKYTEALQGAQDIRPVFEPEGLKSETGIRLVLKIYHDYAEACVEPLNFLRIAYELNNGIDSPEPSKKAQENKRILLPELGDLLNSYNPHLRNSESHLNTRFDHESSKLLISDRGGYSQEYIYTEITAMTNDLAHNFLPGLMNGVILESQITMIILSARSAEYIAALLGIDNAK